VLARRAAEAADLVTVALDELLPRAEGPESRLTEAMRYAALGPGKRLARNVRRQEVRHPRLA
jgi:farnesyl diphosphate synthase